MSGDAAQPHSATADLDEEQNVVRDEPSPCQHFDREEVRASEHVHMRLDELLPGGRATPLGRRWDLVTTQDVADRLIGDPMAQVGQRAHDPIIAPGPVFVRHPDN